MKLKVGDKLFIIEKVDKLLPNEATFLHTYIFLYISEITDITLYNDYCYIDLNPIIGDINRLTVGRSLATRELNEVVIVNLGLFNKRLITTNENAAVETYKELLEKYGAV